MIPSALLSITITLLACAGLAWILTLLTDASPLDAYLATTPAGSTPCSRLPPPPGATSPVAAAQAIRLLVVLISAPFLAARLRRD